MSTEDSKTAQTVEARARNISHNVRCTECGSQSIEDSQADNTILLRKVRDQIHQAGYYVDVDTSDRKIQKKIREAQLAQYNYTLVVGEKEVENGQVSVRIRDQSDHSVKSISDLLEDFKELAATYK